MESRVEAAGEDRPAGGIRPGLQRRDLRGGGLVPAERVDSDPTDQPVRGVEGSRAPLSRRVPGARTSCIEPRPLQPRVSLRPPFFCHPQDHQGAAAIAKGIPPSFVSGTSTPAVTGAGHPTTWPPWCWPRRTRSRATTSSAQASPTPCVIRRRSVRRCRSLRLGEVRGRGPRVLLADRLDQILSRTPRRHARYFGWKPTVGFDDLVGRMVAVDLGA